MSPLLEALSFQAGYNSTLVTIGAALLGFAAGTAGAFLFLRKRALVADAVAHATLPGIGIAFILMTALGGDGRSLVGLLLGAGATALLGMFVVEWLARRTRLGEDVAIGAVLSVFFGIGVVILTIIQGLGTGRQAGLEGFLLGATAGMLLEDAVLIALGGAVIIATIWLLRRHMTLVAFDAGYAATRGVNVRAIDLAMMGVVTAVTVIGLKLVGLVLIVALLIIPPVTARFWTESAARMVWIAGALGAVAAYLGAGLSASAPDLPTGPIVVLVAAGFFAISLLFAPARGAIAALIRHKRFQARVHRRQGLLALARGEAIHDRLTLTILGREGLIRPDGIATDKGRARAAKIVLDEERWAVARRIHQEPSLAGRHHGLTPIEDVYTADEIAAFDRHLAGPQGVN